MRCKCDREPTPRHQKQRFCRRAIERPNCFIEARQQRRYDGQRAVLVETFTSFDAVRAFANPTSLARVNCPFTLRIRNFAIPVKSVKFLFAAPNRLIRPLHLRGSRNRNGATSPYSSLMNSSGQQRKQ